jgi:prepilin-type N-terminal cleavage/methylation domain-containing protein
MSHDKNESAKRGFTLIEMMVVIGIIGVLATFVMIAASGVLMKARDAKRKSDLSQVGRLLTASCYLPDAGAGDYDFGAIAREVLAKNPQYASYISKIPRDPRGGTDNDTKYRYVVNDAGKCAVYANLENANEPMTVPGISAPTAGGGTGVVQGTSNGRNGTNRYFEVTN